MEKIEHKGEVWALHISEREDGSVPLTDTTEPLQVMTLKHDAGEKVAPHRHVPKERKTNTVQECLVVLKGSARVDFYGPDKNVFSSVIIRAGDTLIIQKGGHGVEYLEATEIIEVKNGPFIADKEAI